MANYYIYIMFYIVICLIFGWSQINNSATLCFYDRFYSIQIKPIFTIFTIFYKHFTYNTWAFLRVASS